MKMRLFLINFGVKNYALPFAFNYAFDLSDGFVCVFCRGARKLYLNIHYEKIVINRTERIMKKSSASLIVTVSAFLIGVVLTWVCFYFVSAKPSTTETISQVETKSGDLEVNFKRIYKYETVYVAEFEVVNSSPQDFYFMGYSKNQICGFNFKNVEGLVSSQLIKFDYSSCSCGTGLQKINLASGEKTSFEITVPNKREKVFEVGFEFYTKNNRQFTVWSGNISEKETK